MAIQYNYTDPTTQIQLNYWEIYNIVYDITNNVTSFCLGVYASQAAFQNGAQPFTCVTFNGNTGQLTHDQCQAIVLARPEWSTAVVV